MTENLVKEIAGIIDADRILLNEQMSKHTTFRVGGPADIFISIKTIKEAERNFCLCSKIWRN